MPARCHIASRAGKSSYTVSLTTATLLSTTTRSIPPPRAFNSKSLTASTRSGLKPSSMDGAPSGMPMANSIFTTVSEIPPGLKMLTLLTWIQTQRKGRRFAEATTTRQMTHQLFKRRKCCGQSALDSHWRTANQRLLNMQQTNRQKSTFGTTTRTHRGR